MALSRDPRLLELARRYFDLADLVNIGRRMIGTGLIGGKSAGMLTARAILAKAPQLYALLEVHDSFFIGSDVFTPILCKTNCWWMRRRLKRSGSMYDGAEEMRERMLKGVFPKRSKSSLRRCSITLVTP